MPRCFPGFVPLLRHGSIDTILTDWSEFNCALKDSSTARMRARYCTLMTAEFALPGKVVATRAVEESLVLARLSAHLCGHRAFYNEAIVRGSRSFAWREYLLAPKTIALIAPLRQTAINDYAHRRQLWLPILLFAMLTKTSRWHLSRLRHYMGEARKQSTGKS